MAACSIRSTREMDRPSHYDSVGGCDERGRGDVCVCYEMARCEKASYVRGCVMRGCVMRYESVHYAL